MGKKGTKSAKQGRVTLSEFARLMGKSPTAASKAARLKKFTTERQPDGTILVDPTTAAAEWNANNTRDTKAEQQGKTSSPGTPDFAEARAYRERFNAQLASLEYDKRIGRLVDVDLMEKKWSNVSRSLRNAYLTLPDRVCALVAAVTDPNECHKILTEEINKILEGLSSADRV